MCDGYSLATRTLQAAHLPISPLTAILYVAAKEQPDVTSRQLNSLALVCNWSIVDRSTNLASGCFSFSSTWCRSLFLSFSICYLGILGLEGAINCILARTSHQRTTSEKRAKALLPKCPLFGGSTVFYCLDIQNELTGWFTDYLARRK